MRFKQYGLLGVIVLLIVIFSISAPNFLSTNNFLSMISGMAIVAIGITYSLTVDGFDLSVGSTVTLSNTVIISLLIWYQLSFGLSIVIGILAAIGVAVLNLILILYFKVPDLYATLATMFIVEGISLTYSEGGSISEGMSRADGTQTVGKIPDLFKAIGDPLSSVLLMLFVVIVSYVILNHTNPGRVMYMIGSNKKAAKYSGIKMNRYIAFSYIMSSVLAAIGGVLLASQVASAQVNSGAGYLMTAVAASFIGATTSKAGKPNVMGTFLGALLIAILENGLVMLSVPYYGLNIVKGSVLAIALILNYAHFKRGL